MSKFVKVKLESGNLYLENGLHIGTCSDYNAFKEAEPVKEYNIIDDVIKLKSAGFTAEEIASLGFGVRK